MVPVFADIGKNDVPHADLFHAAPRLFDVAHLQPAFGGHFAALGVNAHGDALAVLFHGFPHKRRVFQCH